MLSLLAAALSLSTCIAAGRDAASQAVRTYPVSVQAQVKVLSPPMASELRGYDCRSDASLEKLKAGQVLSASRANVRIYASGGDCLFQQGARYRVSGQLSVSRFGRARLQLALPKATTSTSKLARLSSRDHPQPSVVRLLEGPNVVHRAIGRMQSDFLQVTRQLSDQGRVLVPGLTLGVLGQESFLPAAADGTSGDAIVPAYASGLKDNFKRAGIMHLMAVSGSHFLLLGTLIGKLLRAVKAPRSVHSVCLLLAYTALAMAMYPSDSVLRAQVMGMLSALSLLVGRRRQSVSALAWTSIGVLFYKPEMAVSFGFALSCAAVLAITIGAEPLSRLLGDHMPACLAAPLAMTVLAQAGTLPIQVLMSAQLPLFSPVANLLVSPFVDIATICGLLALVSAWVCPGLALCFSRLSSIGTGVMELTANQLGGPQSSVLPWPPGLFGALAVVVWQVAAVLLVLSAQRARQRLLFSRDPALDPDLVKAGLGLDGELYRPSLWSRACAYWQSIRSLLPSPGA
ncbi:competence protein [Bombiscardovia nodaiensis]|uniref:Competence protein n=1 Tax=Bombiscardovia nodaiensis TaxID=2932181 RepID=A0ABM8B853_9BIFI|nr:competence protein [Bombiscardovia nodaiensis]